MFQSETADENGSFDVTDIPGPLALIVVKADVTEQLVEVLRGGIRISGNFTSNILSNVDAGEKLRCANANEKNPHNTLVFRINGNQEK